MAIVSQINNIALKKVHSFNCPEIPKENETFLDYFDLDILFPHIYAISYYLRSPEDCPLARGNWMIDMEMKDGTIVACKYPKEMTEERFVSFIQPLLDRMIE